LPHLGINDSTLVTTAEPLKEPKW
jgi:hypothetical protein